MSKRPRGVTAKEWAAQQAAAEAEGKVLILESKGRYTVLCPQQDVIRCAGDLGKMDRQKRRALITHNQRDIDSLMPLQISGKITPAQNRELCSAIAQVFANEWRMGRAHMRGFKAPVEEKEEVHA